MGLLPNRLSVIVMTIGLAILGYSEICRADWILFDKGTDADFYYDGEDMKRSSSGIVTLWLKRIYTEKGRAEMSVILGSRSEELDHSITLSDIDCVGKMILPLSSVYFSKDRKVLEIKESSSQWEFVGEGSPFEVLCGKVCPH